MSPEVFCQEKALGNIFDKDIERGKGKKRKEKKEHEKQKKL